MHKVLLKLVVLDIIALATCKIEYTDFPPDPAYYITGYAGYSTPCKVVYTLFCMTTAIYLRVSSPKGQKTDSQRAELEAWLRRHHYKSVQWFEDRESATTMQRDAFQRLQAAIFAGTITTVVVWKLDR